MAFGHGLVQALLLLCFRDALGGLDHADLRGPDERFREEESEIAAQHGIERRGPLSRPQQFLTLPQQGGVLGRQRLQHIVQVSVTQLVYLQLRRG